MMFLCEWRACQTAYMFFSHRCRPLTHSKISLDGINSDRGDLARQDEIIQQRLSEEALCSGRLRQLP